MFFVAALVICLVLLDSVVSVVSKNLGALKHFGGQIKLASEIDFLSLFKWVV